MCKALLRKAAELNMKSPHGQLRQTISRDDPLSKALGYEGLMDPLGDLESSLSGQPTKLDIKRRRNANEVATAQQNADYRRRVQAEGPGHVRAISGYYRGA